MIKEFEVVDNILDDPFTAIELAKKTEYFYRDSPYIKDIKQSNKPDNFGGYWKGCRSELLHEIYPEFFSFTFNNVIQKLFKANKFSYNIESYFHYTNRYIVCDNKWHKDDIDILWAGIIYLTPDPPVNTGTNLIINKEQISIENKFNRLALYQSNILHEPADLFGTTVDSARLTIVFFINKLNLYY